VVGDKTYILEPSNDPPFGIQMRVCSKEDPMGQPTRFRYWINRDGGVDLGERGFSIRSLILVGFPSIGIWTDKEGFEIYAPPLRRIPVGKIKYFREDEVRERLTQLALGVFEGLLNYERTLEEKRVLVRQGIDGNH